MPTPTVQQQTAITTVDRALVVEAGAGTGKTWVLVERYLHLLALHPDWPIESIVAITFTEKAAREMRNRIRGGVEARARRHPHDVHWQERRRRLDQIQVSTIHSLCARILRENAIAATLDPKFDVLDEAAATLLAEEAIRQTLADLSQDADHPALALFASLSVFDVKNTMAELLSRRGTVEQLFDKLEDKASLLDKWETAVGKMLAQRWQQTVAQNPDLAEALDDLPSVPIVDASDLLAGAVRLAQDGCRHIDRGDFAQAVACFAQINRSGGKAANWGGADGKKMVSAMLAAVQQLGKDWVKAGVTEPVGVLDEAAADNLQAWRSLWQTLTAAYDRLKDEQHVLDFDDLERHTVRLLKQDPQSDRLHAFLDGIHHVMVDEFQDTNPIQRQIVYALAPLEMSGRLFVVGDAKQSIYRFRQAQVSIFNQTAQDVLAATGYDAQPLNQSFRTHQELVNGFNHLFDHVLQPLNGARHQDYEALPGPLTAQRAAFPDAPPIELWILPKEDDDGKINAEEGRRWEASLLADRLLALKDSHTQIWGKETGKHRPFEFRDAAILFRATTSLPLYEEVFKQKELPYLTISGRGYYDRPEVQHLLSLLAALYNPADDFNLAAVLRSPLFGLSDETLFRLRCFDAAGQPMKDVRPLRAALSDPPLREQATWDQDDVVRHAGTVLEELWAQRGRADVWQLLRLAVDSTGYATALALLDRDGIGGGRQLSNVQKFLSMARESGGANLSDFLRRVNDLRAAEAREGEALGREPESGAVQLMSIHASKGLEFPVVAVADLGREPRNNRSDYILHDPMIGLVCKVRDDNGEWQTPASYNWGRWQIEQMEAAEDKRLLYVACTRAADQLILSGRDGAKGSWMAQLLTAWAIAAAGDETETWHSATVDPACDPFRITIHRPTARPDLDQNTTTSPKPTHDGLVHAVALSRPLPPVPVSEARTVTRFLREAAQADAVEDGGLALRPAVRPRTGPQPFYPVPRYVVGNIVHRALADWSVLALAASDLHTVLTGIARSLGVADPRSAADAAARAGRLLANLKAGPLYRQIDSASRRLHEIPFTLSTTQGVLNGVIDLLFEDATGWHLLDWKTEWARIDEAEVKAAEFLPQLAIYHHAAQRILGVSPRTGVCLLAAGASVHWFEEGVLAEYSSSRIR